MTASFMDATALAASDMSSSGSAPASVTLGLILLVFYAACLCVVPGVIWAGIFKKAGHESWKAFVPFYNYWILVMIAGRPPAHFWFMFIPYFNIYIQIVTLNDIARSFGKDSGYTVGLVLLPIVFGPMLSYGDASYRGPSYLTPEQKFYYQQHYAQQAAAWQAQQAAAWQAQQAQPASGPTEQAQPGSGGRTD